MENLVSIAVKNILYQYSAQHFILCKQAGYGTKPSRRWSSST